MQPSPLALTDSQLAAVMSAAAPLLPLDRDPFLRAVAARLRSEPSIGDGTVARVLRELQKEFLRHAPQLDGAEEVRPISFRRTGKGKYW